MNKQIGNRRINNNLFVITILLYFIILESELIGNYAVIILLLPYIQIYAIPKKIGLLSRILLCIIIYAVIITIINYKSNYNISNSINLLIEYMIIYFACLNWKNVDYIRVLKKIRNGGIILAGFSIIEGIVNFPFFKYVMTLGRLNVDQVSSANYRTVSIFGASIIFGTVLIVIWVLVLIFPFHNYKFNYLSTVCIFAAALFNKSRSAWIAILLVTIIFYFHSKKRIHLNKKWINIIFLSIVIVVVLSVMGINIIDGVIQTVYERIHGMLDAGEGQIIRFETVITSFKYWFEEGHLVEFVFGGGKNADKIFLSIHPVIKGNGTFVWDGAIDNQYVTIIHEYGLVGLLLFVSIILVLLKRMRKRVALWENYNFASVSLIGIFLSIFFYEGLNYTPIFWIMNSLIVISDVVYESKNERNLNVA